MGNPFLNYLARNEGAAPQADPFDTGVAPAAESANPYLDDGAGNPYLDGGDAGTDAGTSQQAASALRVGGGGEGGFTGTGEGGTTPAAERGPVRKVWDAVSAPLKAATGVTGSAAVQALQLRRLFPDAYAGAEAENRAGITGGEDRELSLMEKAETLPGVGDMIAQGIDPQGTVGRFTRTPVRIAGNILGDPTTYIGEGLVARAVSPVARATQALGRVQEAIKVAEGVGDAAKVAELTAHLPALAGRLAEMTGAETAVGRGARTIAEALENVGRPGAGGSAARELTRATDFTSAVRGVGKLGATLPFGPIAGVAYAPEMAEGIAGGTQDAFHAWAQGRYGDAVASGAGALLTTGLSAMIARGTIHEAQAAGVLERHLRGEAPGATGATATPESPAAAPASAPAPAPAAPVVPPAGAQGAQPLPPVTPQAGAVAPQAPPPSRREPHARSASLQVESSPSHVAALHQLLDQAQAEGRVVTKADLVNAGMLTPRQAKDRGLQEILDRFDTGLYDRLEFKAGRGYTVTGAAEGGAGGAAVAGAVVPQAAAEAAPQAAVQGAALTPEAIPTAPAGDATVPEAPPPTQGAGGTGGRRASSLPQEIVPEEPVSTAPDAPTRFENGRSGMTRAEIEASLGKPGVRPFYETTLESLAKAKKTEVLALTGADLREFLPGADNAKARAGLHHVLAQMKAAEKRKLAGGGEGEGGGGGGVDASFAAYDDQGQPILTELQMPARDREGEPDPNAHIGAISRPMQDTLHAPREEPVRTPPAPAEDDASPLLSRIFSSAQHHDIPLDKVLAQAEERIGKPMDDWSADDLNYVFTSMERDPASFGAPARELLVPQIHEPAVHRLLGETKPHTIVPSAKGRGEARDKVDFVGYDPASPAGRLQERARTAQGVDAEGRLQEVVTRRLGDLSKNDLRHFTRAFIETEAYMEKRGAEIDAMRSAGKTAEADAAQQALDNHVKTKREQGLRKTNNDQNWRRLLLEEPNTEKARAELTKLLGMDLTRQRQSAFQTREGRLPGEAARAIPLEDSHLVSTLMGDELSPEERSRLAASGLKLVENDQAAKPDLQFTIPPRDAAETPDAYRKRLVGSDLRKATADSVVKLYRDWRESAKAHTGEVNPALQQARKLAEDVGMSTSSKRGGDRFFNQLATFLGGHGEDAHPSVASELLTSANIGGRRERYLANIEKSGPLGDTGAVVADLNGGPSSRFTGSLGHLGDLGNSLARITHDLGASIEMPTRFGGLISDHELNAVRVDGSAYVNPFHARVRAVAELADRGLSGDAYRTALDTATARNIVDDTLHEITHAKARHDAATGDSDFISAYAQAVKDAAPHYMDAIREVREHLAGSSVLDSQLDDYTKSFESWKEEIRGRAAGAGSGAVAGPGATASAGTAPRRIAPIPNRPGGGEGGAGGGLRDGARSGEPVQPGGERAPGVVREGAAAAEGATGRLAGGDTAVHGNLVTDALTAYRDGKNERAFDRVAKLYASSMAKFEGNPARAEEIERQMEAVRNLPEEMRAKLQTAGPQRPFDIGVNLNRYADEAMSPEQREMVGAILAMRNSDFSRSKPLTFDQVREGMKDILETNTPEDVIDMAKLKAKGMFTPSDMAAMRAITATFAQGEDEARALLRAAEIAKDAPGIEKAKAELVRAEAAKFTAIGAMVPHSTNAARLLSSMRMIAHPLGFGEEFKSRVLGSFRAAGVKQAKAEELFEMFKDVAAQGATANRTRFMNALREATQPTKLGKFMEFWKAGLLGWPTQVANIASNTGFRAMRDVENSVSVLANIVGAKLTGQSADRHLKEVSMRAFATKNALSEAWGMLKGDLGDIFSLKAPDVYERFKRGSAFDDVEVHRLAGAIEGKTGEFVRIPFKLLDAADNFFKHISRSQEYGAQAVRLAHDASFRSPGEAVDHAINRIHNEIRSAVADPFGRSGLYEKYKNAGVWEQVKKIALGDTFQSPLGPSAQKLYQSTQAHPALQFIFPFFKTPYNIISEGMKRTPLGAALAIKRYMNGEIKNPEFIESMVKSAIGTTLMGVTFQSALGGDITGGGPSDPKEAELLKRTGWQPYSMKIGDSYYSYSRFEPMSTLLGTGADIAEAYQRKDIDSASDLISKFVSSGSNLVTNKSFVAGWSHVMDILTDPQRKGLTAMKALEASLVPNNVGVVPVGQLARALDPNFRETEALTASPLLANIPGVSQLLEPQRQPTGEVRERKGTFLEKLLSPVYRSEVETGPIAESAAEITRLGRSLEAPPMYMRAGNDKVYYTPEEREEISRAQEKGLDKIANVIRSSSYQRLPDNETAAAPGARTKWDVLLSIVNESRRPALERANRAAINRARETS